MRKIISYFVSCLPDVHEKFPIVLFCILTLLLPVFSVACQDGSKDDPVGTCSSDMVLVDAATDFCIDKYEASRSDATSGSQGVNVDLANSNAEVIPWYPVTYSEAVAACEAAGKRICIKEEWARACSGPDSYTYVYGGTYNEAACNVYTGTPNIAATGSFSSCVSADGIYDLCGNVAEVVFSGDDARGYEIRGGAYNFTTPADFTTCSHNFSIDPSAMGFRCCKGPDFE